SHSTGGEGKASVRSVKMVWGESDGDAPRRRRAGHPARPTVRASSASPSLSSPGQSIPSTERTRRRSGDPAPESCHVPAPNAPPARQAAVASTLSTIRSGGSGNEPHAEFTDLVTHRQALDPPGRNARHPVHRAGDLTGHRPGCVCVIAQVGCPKDGPFEGVCRPDAPHRGFEALDDIAGADDLVLRLSAVVTAGDGLDTWRAAEG